MVVARRIVPTIAVGFRIRGTIFARAIILIVGRVVAARRVVRCVARIILRSRAIAISPRRRIAIIRWAHVVGTRIIVATVRWRIVRWPIMSIARTIIRSIVGIGRLAALIAAIAVIVTATTTR